MGLTASEARAGIVVTTAGGDISYGTAPGEFSFYNPVIPGRDELVFRKGQVSQDSAFKAGGGFVINVRTLIDSDIGADPHHCRTGFEMRFTIDQPMRYRFTASLIDQDSFEFAARLDGSIASLFRDSAGNPVSSIPLDPDTGKYGTFVEEGILALGSGDTKDDEHGFFVEAIGDEFKGAAARAAGTATLELQPIPSHRRSARGSACSPR
jgi:hypothetical protein